MDAAMMTTLHETGGHAPWQWRLPAHEARRLPAAPLRRWLAVESGRVWLTRSHRDFDHGDDDIWLQPGESQLLPPGTEWVAEGWPSARVVVLEAAPGDAAAARR